MGPFSKISIFYFKRNRQEKKFYEGRDNESVDEKNLSLAMSRKTSKKKIQEIKG